MQWYFKEHGWSSSTLFELPQTSDMNCAKLIETLQDWKVRKYKEIIKPGTVRPSLGVLGVFGVLRLLDEAKYVGMSCMVFYGWVYNWHRKLVQNWHRKWKLFMSDVSTIDPKLT